MKEIDIKLTAFSGATVPMLIIGKFDSIVQLDITVSRIGISSTGVKPITKQAAARTSIGTRILMGDSWA